MGEEWKDKETSLKLALFVRRIQNWLGPVEPSSHPDHSEVSDKIYLSSLVSSTSFCLCHRGLQEPKLQGKKCLKRKSASSCNSISQSDRLPPFTGKTCGTSGKSIGFSSASLQSLFDLRTDFVGIVFNAIELKTAPRELGQ